jgi:hypothetical protein
LYELKLRPFADVDGRATEKNKEGRNTFPQVGEECRMTDHKSNEYIMENY